MKVSTTPQGKENTVKVFYRSFDANGQLEASLRMADVPDHVAYAAAHKVHDAEFVTNQLDGKGWINLRQNHKTHGGYTETTYQQDDL